ncbi:MULTISPECIES: type II toxin-antitoxin system RelE/ParE family toxin [Photorhabdus]
MTNLVKNNGVRVMGKNYDAEDVGEINLPGYNLHPLTGDRRGQWAITVSGNWRITFEFIDGDAYIVNYEDYH